jgi:predicted nucleotide-binding protein (sugar kinase/HSP70/actin superfamily)
VKKDTSLLEEDKEEAFEDNLKAATEYNSQHYNPVINEEKIVAEMNGESGWDLDEVTIKKIEAELDGRNNTYIDEEKIRLEIESEISVKVDETMVKKIEMELLNSPF